MNHPACRNTILLLLWLGLALCPVSAGQAAPIGPRLQAMLADAGDADAIPVIVTFRDGADFSRLPAGPRQHRRAELVRTLKGRAEVVQGPAREFLRERGGGPIKDLWIINGLAVTASPETILALAARPEVTGIRSDEVIPLPEVSPAQAVAPAEANVERVRAPRLWELGFAGQGVTVATMDSGVDVNHPELGPRWRGGSNSWFDPNGEHPLPVDGDGHGTGVMGILVGGHAGGTAIGVAPQSQWIAVKIFNDAGTASYSAIHQGFGWLLDPDGNPASDDAPDVVNNSWGFEDTPGVCDQPAREFQADVQALKAAGIAVVFAAGNTGPAANTSTAPGSYPGAFAVGSVGTLRSPVTISDFSARGPSACDDAIYPEAVAPGFVVRTADLAGAYVHVAGTSFAAPHVSGVMALLLSARPGTAVETIEAALRQSAVDLGGVGPDNSYGYGLVDALAALNALTGVPHLEVFDPVPPENDRHVDFGSIPPGRTAEQLLTLRNAGSGFLAIHSASGLQPPFVLAADDCSGRTLAAGNSCTLTVRFEPRAHAAFTAGLDIAANDPGENPVTVALAGAGNTPPPAPQLLTPAAGAIGLDATVVLEWSQLSDADGDAVTNEVLLSTREDFSEGPPVDVTIAAAAGGFLTVFGAAAWCGRRRWPLPVLCLAAAALALLLSCGGGSGTAAERRSKTLTGLAPATTYFWKVAAVDDLGGRTESPIRHFTTR